jgi:hypothetical protein
MIVEGSGMLPILRVYVVVTPCPDFIAPGAHSARAGDRSPPHCVEISIAPLVRPLSFPSAPEQDVCSMAHVYRLWRL